MMKTAQNRAYKEQLKSNISGSKQNVNEKIKREADNIKQEKRE
jgi:hypothetical protein